jgi:hypothetical protein
LNKKKLRIAIALTLVTIVFAAFAYGAMTLWSRTPSILVTNKYIQASIISASFPLASNNSIPESTTWFDDGNGTQQMFVCIFNMTGMPTGYLNVTATNLNTTRYALNISSVSIQKLYFTSPNWNIVNETVLSSNVALGTPVAFNKADVLFGVPKGVVLDGTIYKNCTAICVKLQLTQLVPVDNPDDTIGTRIELTS